jgi:hypothetical protein
MGYLLALTHRAYFLLFLFALMILTRQFKAMGTWRFPMSRIKGLELLAETAS